AITSKEAAKRVQRIENAANVTGKRHSQLRRSSSALRKPNRLINPMISNQRATPEWTPFTKPREANHQTASRHAITNIPMNKREKRSSANRYLAKNNQRRPTR